MTTPADLFIIRIYVTYACRFMTFKGRYKKVSLRIMYRRETFKRSVIKSDRLNLSS